MTITSEQAAELRGYYSRTVTVAERVLADGRRSGASTYDAQPIQEERDNAAAVLALLDDYERLRAFEGEVRSAAEAPESRRVERAAFVGSNTLRALGALDRARNGG